MRARVNVAIIYRTAMKRAYHITTQY